MFELPEESPVERALRDGLAALPVREPAANFDAAILAALHPRASWQQTLRNALRPTLPAAACSALVMTVLLGWTAQMPLTPLPRSTGEHRRSPIAERIFNGDDLSHINLSLLNGPPGSPPPNSPPQPKHTERTPHRSPIGPHAQSAPRPFA